MLYMAHVSDYYAVIHMNYNWARFICKNKHKVSDYDIFRIQLHKTLKLSKVCFRHNPIIVYKSWKRFAKTIKVLIYELRDQKIYPDVKKFKSSYIIRYYMQYRKLIDNLLENNTE